MVDRCAAKVSLLRSFRTFVGSFKTDGFRPSTRAYHRLLRDVPYLAALSRDDFQGIYKRARELRLSFNFVNFAKNHPNIRSVEEFRSAISSNFAWLDAVRKIQQPLPDTNAEELSRIHFVPDYEELHQLQRLFQTTDAFHFIPFGIESEFTRYGGGPAEILGTDSGHQTRNINFSAELLERLPWPLLSATLILHLRLTELANRNENKIGAWILDQARNKFAAENAELAATYTPRNLDNQVHPPPNPNDPLLRLGLDEGLIFDNVRDVNPFSPDSSNYRLRPALKAALIEKALLVELLEIYRKIRNLEGFDWVKIPIFERWAASGDIEGEIGQMLNRDYGLGPLLLDLRDGRANLEAIVGAQDGTSLEQLHAERSARQQPQE